MRFFLCVCVALFSFQALSGQRRSIASVVNKFQPTIDPVAVAKHLMLSSSFVRWVALFNNMETHKVRVENIMDLEVDDGPAIFLRRDLAKGYISNEVLDNLQRMGFNGGTAALLRQLIGSGVVEVEDLDTIASYMEEAALATARLLAAAYRGDAGEVTKALEAGADVSATLNSQTARHIIDLKNTDMPSHEYAKPAIALAAAKQHRTVVEILLAHGAAPDMPDMPDSDSGR